MNTSERVSLCCWNTGALSAFKFSLGANLITDEVGGRDVRSFAARLQGVGDAQLPEGRISRSGVFNLAENPEISTIAVCAAALAWGGMNEGFSQGFFAQAGNGWLDIADMIRRGELSRQQAYGEFSTLREGGQLPGIGPAYFTKIIYFLTPKCVAARKQPFIMDQWAGCSINLLLSQELVKMNVSRVWKRNKDKPDFSYQVSEVNTAEDYEAFCAAVDALRAECALTPEKVDRAMVANGGRKRSSWRRYVIENRTV